MPAQPLEILYTTPLSLVLQSCVTFSLSLMQLRANHSLSKDRKMLVAITAQPLEVTHATQLSLREQLHVTHLLL